MQFHVLKLCWLIERLDVRNPEPLVIVVEQPEPAHSPPHPPSRAAVAGRFADGRATRQSQQAHAHKSSPLDDSAAQYGSSWFFRWVSLLRFIQTVKKFFDFLQALEILEQHWKQNVEICKCFDLLLFWKKNPTLLPIYQATVNFKGLENVK